MILFVWDMINIKIKLGEDLFIAGLGLSNFWSISCSFSSSILAISYSFKIVVYNSWLIIISLSKRAHSTLYSGLAFSPNTNRPIDIESPPILTLVLIYFILLF